MHYTDYKTILSPKNVMNLYRGCSHGCIYCDSRSTCYQITHDFEDIGVKRNAIKILEGELRKKRSPSMLSTGSMTDPYMPLEIKLELTRASLKLVKRYGFGISIITKSANVLRDIDLIKSINEKTKCVVQMTLTTHDEDLCQILEPNVSTTFERFQVLEILRDNNIPTVVWMSPILPFINDTEENLLGLMDYCIRAKVIGIMNFGFGMTLRDGSRDYFYKKLDFHFPGMKEQYIKVFGNSYECPSPKNDYLMSIFKDLCKEHNIIYKPNEVFAYLNKFETKSEQLSVL